MRNYKLLTGKVELLLRTVAEAGWTLAVRKSKGVLV